MKITSFQVINCFGFGDSTRVNLDDSTNLIYLLGKNSSGKTAFLTALSHLDRERVPVNHPNFENFEPTGEVPHLLAEFTMFGGPAPIPELILPDFLNALRARIRTGSHVDPYLRESPLYAQQSEKFEQTLQEPYGTLIENITRAGRAWVRRSGNGDYEIAPGPDFTDVVSRREQVTAGLDRIFPLGQFREPNSARPIPFGPMDVERCLYDLFPRVSMVARTANGADGIPKRITIEELNTADSRSLLGILISYLDPDLVRNFVSGNNPKTQERIRLDMQHRLDTLAQDINRFSQATGSMDNLIQLIPHHAHNGLQITVDTNGTLSFYDQISDNTKILFAYFLRQRTEQIHGDALLFDEPDSGFHSSAQVHVLNFLKTLGRMGKQVIIATHSEHLIDPDHLTGVRLMGADNYGRLVVSPHYHAPVGEGSKSDYLALRPITDAIGHKYGASKLHVRDKVIITEGVTDKIYLDAFNHLMGHQEILHIAPARGTDTIAPVVSLLISQDLRFKIVVDASSKSKDSIKAKLQADYPIADAHFFEVTVPDGITSPRGAGVEDIFSKADFGKLIRDCGWSLRPDFDANSNADYMRLKDAPKPPSKRVLAEWFLQMVHGGQYTRTDFDPQTLGRINDALTFCHNEEWFRMHVP